MWYGMFYDRKAEIRCEEQPEHIYSLCGVDRQGKTLTMVTYYTEEDETAPEKTITLDFGRPGEYEITLLDATHNAVPMGVTGDLTFTMKPSTCILIQEK